MSRLLDSITYRLTGQRFTGYEPLRLVEGVRVDSTIVNYLEGIRIEATFGVTTKCKADETELSVLLFKQRLVEEVFGEFREDLFELEQLCYEIGSKDGGEIVRGLKKKMYSI